MECGQESVWICDQEKTRRNRTCAQRTRISEIQNEAGIRSLTEIRKKAVTISSIRNREKHMLLQTARIFFPPNIEWSLVSSKLPTTNFLYMTTLANLHGRVHDRRRRRLQCGRMVKKMAQTSVHSVEATAIHDAGKEE
jgi:hypothetical protein